MRKISRVVAILMVLVFTGSAFANEAKDGLIKYTGTHTFTTLSEEQRVGVLQYLADETITDDGRSGALTLVAKAPRAVSVAQRKAIVAVFSGNGVSSNGSSSSKNETISDNSGAIIGGIIVGGIIGAVIANNSGHRHRDPGPGPRPGPGGPGGPRPGGPGGRR